MFLRQKKILAAIMALVLSYTTYTTPVPTSPTTNLELI